MDTGNNGGPLTNIALDAVGEFKILTSDYQAEYGRSVGAQIIAVTRSGSRDFHGSFYLYRRQGGLNANTWLNNRNGTPRPFQDQRDLGYTIGGPIYIPGVFNKDRQKLFFFWHQEYQHRFNPPANPTNVRVPTLLERQGDFSQSRDNNGALYPYIRDYTTGPPCSASDTRGCFQDGGVLGKIPQNRLYGVGLAILKLYPEPNYTPTGGDNFNYRTQEPSNTPERDDTLRVDYNISSDWRVYGRWLKNKANVLLPYGDFVLGTNLPPFAAGRSIPRYSFAGTLTGSLSPTTVIEVTYGISHNQIDIFPGADKHTRTATGLTSFPTLYPGAVTLDLIPQFTYGGRVAGGPNIGTNNAPFYNFNTTQDTDFQGANFIPGRFSPTQAPRLFRPICINGAATCNSGANRRAVDPALLAPGFAPTASNTLPDFNIGRIVPNTGSLTNGIFVSGNGIERALVKDRGVHFGPRFGFAFECEFGPICD